MPPSVLNSPSLDSAVDAVPRIAAAEPARDWQQLAPAPSTRPVPSALRPVECPAAVWSLAQREFRPARVAQIPMRARTLDLLELMSRGHLLAMMGAGTPTLWLDGQHDVALLAGVLFGYGYVEIAGRHRDNPHVVYFRLSEAGRRKLAEGRAWWRSLTLWQRLQVRLFG